MIGHILEKAFHPANKCECCDSGCDCGCVETCPVCRGKSWREREQPDPASRTDRATE